MTLNKFASQYRLISRYLDKNKDIPSEIKSYLADFLAISFYSEIEEKIKTMIENRVSLVNDEIIKKFSLAKKYPRGISIKDIKNTLQQFSENYKSNFDNELSVEEKTLYNNIINARHNICHGGKSSNITIEEIQNNDYMAVGNKVIQKFSAVLGVELSSKDKKA